MVTCVAVAVTGRADECLFFATPRLPEKSEDARFVRLRPHLALPKEVALNPRRGSVAVRLTPRGPFGGYPAVVEIYPGPPHVSMRVTAAHPKPKDGDPVPAAPPLICTVAVTLRYAPDGNALDSVTAKAEIEPDKSLHVAWTWAGVRHALYLNGRLLAERIAASPFPSRLTPPVRLLSNYSQEILDAAPVHEIAAYDFAMTPAEVAEDAASEDDLPLAARAPHGPSVAAQWAPGERKAYVAVDAGNALAGTAVTARLSVLRDSAESATTSMPVADDGFAETLVALPAMPAGSYQVVAALLDAQDVPQASAASPPWELPETPWLGNSLGLTNTVQPPWTPVEADGTTLKVWGREYRLGGGFGLPVQIVSQNRQWLAAPVTLDVMRAGQSLALTDARVEISAVRPHAAAWRGSAEAGDVAVSVRGRLEYDGMILITLTLAPRDPTRPVVLDAIRLNTAMPEDRALFLNTATDQGYWWYSYKAWIPEAPGVVHDNLRQRAARTSFLFFTLFSDHDTGLEWFADNLAGWQVDESRPVQEIVREPDGTVRLVCHLANQPVELREPITVTFGYDATPVKPLPADWRSAYIHYAPLADIASDLALWWLWSDSRFDPARPNVFLLRPNDLEAFAAARARTFKVKLSPFVNQHVTLPTFPENQQPDGGWDWFNNLLGAESANDGWTAMPTRGVRDFWAWNLNTWLDSGSLDAIYIDEANTQTVHASLLTGSGWRRADGTHAFGHNTLGMREQLRRVRQLLLDHGKRPLVWTPTYGMIIPHAFAFVDINSEGEAYMFDKPDGPDWIDVWGAEFLERTGGPGARGGPWLMSLGPAQKFGFIPIFLNYIKFYSRPEYLPAMRAQYALLGLLDIIPIGPELGWFYKAKQDFGMSAPETTFHRFFEQGEVTAARDDVKISYYRRGQSMLLFAANLGKEPYAGGAAVNLAALGMADAAVEVAEVVPVNEARLTTGYEYRLLPGGVRDGRIALSVPPHDFRMIRIRPAETGGPD